MRCTPLRTTASTTDEQHPQWQQALPAGSAFQQISCLLLSVMKQPVAVIFEEWGNFVRANDCLRLKRYYERRAMEECLDPGPT